MKLSDDATLRSLAERESKVPLPRDEVVSVADEWWTVADKQTGLAKQNVRRHAVELYRTALPELGGLAKIRVNKRLAEVDSESIKPIAAPANAVGPAARADIPLHPAQPAPGQIKAPDFPAIRLVYRDDFSKESFKTTSSRDKFGVMSFGCKNGLLCMSFDPSSPSSAKHLNELLPWSGSDFAIRVTARIRATPGDVWETTIQSQSEKLELGVSLSNQGKVIIAPTAISFRQEGPRLEPIAPENMKPGDEFNTLMIVAMQQRAWIFVNGLSVCDPVTLPDGIYPPKIRLAAKMKGGTAEFDDVSIWSVKQFP